MTYFPLASAEIVAVTRRAVSGSHACDPVEPDRQSRAGAALRHQHHPRRRWLQLVLPRPAWDR